MERKNYFFAGVEYQIAMPEKLMYTDDRHLANFAVDSVTDPHVFTFDMVDKLPPPQGETVVVKPGFRVYEENGETVRYIGSVEKSWEYAYICAAHNGKKHHVLLKRSEFTGRVGTHTVLSALAAEHLTVQAGGVIFHCSYIDYNGKAVLFTAPSETGKSTQAELWHKHRGVEIINGDRAAIRLADGKLYADGLPFAGSSTYYVNRTLPLAAIVYLGQAPVTTIRKMRGYEAFAKVWEGISVNTWDRDDMEKVSALVKHIAENIPVFYMPCTPDEDAVMVLESALKGEEQ